MRVRREELPVLVVVAGSVGGGVVAAARELADGWVGEDVRGLRRGHVFVVFGWAVGSERHLGRGLGLLVWCRSVWWLLSRGVVEVASARCCAVGLESRARAMVLCTLDSLDWCGMRWALRWDEWEACRHRTGLMFERLAPSEDRGPPSSARRSYFELNDRSGVQAVGHNWQPIPFKLGSGSKEWNTASGSSLFSVGDATPHGALP